MANLGGFRKRLAATASRYRVVLVSGVSHIVRSSADTAELPGAFQRLLVGVAISSLGDGFLQFGLALLVEKQTHNPLLVALVLVFGRLPWLVLSLPMGAIADRFQPRRLMVAADLARAAALTMLGVVTLVQHRAPLGLLYPSVFVLGAGEVLFYGSSTSIVQHVVSPANLPKANGRLESVRVTNEFFTGVVLGAWAFSVSKALPLLIDAVSFVLCALVVAGLPVLARSGVGQSLRRDVADGFAWFRSSRAVQLLVGLVGGGALAQGLTLGILASYGKEDLRLSDGGYLLFLVVIAVCNVFGAVIGERVANRFNSHSILVTNAVLIGFGYLIASTPNTRSLAFVGFAIEGVLISVGNVAYHSARQRLVPPMFAGRIATVARTIVYGLSTVGFFVGGLIARTWSGYATVRVAGILYIVAVVLFARPLRRHLAGRTVAGAPAPANADR